MSANPDYQSQLNREHIASLLTPLSYNSASKMFFTSENELAFGWVAHPATGANEQTADKLTMLLSLAFPANSTLSFTLYASPDIDGYIAHLLALRERASFGSHPVVERSIRNKVEFLRGGTQRRLNDRVYSLVRDVGLCITCKIPISGGGLPSDRDLRIAAELRTSLEKGFEGIGIMPLAMNHQIYLHLMGTLVNWGDKPSWRDGGPGYDPTAMLNDQVPDLDTRIDIDPSQARTLRVGRKYVKVLSVKRYPEFVALPVMQMLVGNVNHGQDGIAGNFIATMNVLFPDQSDERGALEKKRTMTNYQAMGPVAALNPALRERKNDFDLLFQAVDGGDRIVKMHHVFVVFEDSEEASTAAATAMISYYRDLQLHVQEDRFISLPLFVNSLPFGADASGHAVSLFKRHRTVGASHAANLAPVISDWKGTQRPVLTYISRNGQIMGVDLFESSTNFNGVIAAQSGSGKSFLTQDMITSYLSVGGRVYCIDVGRSYKKIAEVYDGQFLVFSKDSDLCLNPFELVNDFEEEGSMLVDMIKSMASQSGGMGDWETSAVQKAVKEVWDDKGRAAMIDDIARLLQSHEDKRARDIGDQLFSFTSGGEYGRWFNGRNNASFRSRLTVLELEELKSKPHLQAVILMQIIYQIQSDIYLREDRSQPVLIVIDECWSLLNIGDVAAFIISAFRRARKYGAGIWIITQSVSDLYADEKVGVPMIENAAWLFLLGQKGESIDNVERTKRLSLSPAGFKLLKTVQTVRGRYSEVFIYTSSYNGAQAAGIGRLIVSRFDQLMYTTDAREISSIQKYQAAGMPLADAINAVIRDEEIAAHASSH